MKLNKIKERVIKSYCEKYKVDYDKLDYVALWDNSLTDGENMAYIKKVVEDISINRIPVKPVETLPIKTFIEEDIEDLKPQTPQPQNILDKYNPPKEFINLILSKDSDINSVILTGDAGLGKTYMVQRALKEKGIDYVEIKGVISPLALYKKLWENREGVIVFDDIASIIGNGNTYSIFLNIMFGGKTAWDSTTRLSGTTPSEFKFKGKIIVITNNFSGKMKEREEIIKSRCYHYELILNYKDKISMMYYIAEQEHSQLSKEERKNIVDFIKENTDESSIIDLRTQQKIEQVFLYSKDSWEELSKRLLIKDEETALLMSCLKRNNLVRDAEKEWVFKTGKSRRTFYRRKEELTL